MQGRLVLLLGQRPRLFDLQIPVDGAHRRDHLLNAGTQLHVCDGVFHALGGGLDALPQGLLFRGVERLGGDLREHAATVARGHVQHAAEQVPQVVGKVSVIAADKGLLGKAGILPQIHLGHHKVAEGIQPIAVNHVHRVDGVPQRLAHLALAAEPPAMRKNHLRLRHAHGLEHRRPVHRVRGQNVFADQMAGGGPPLLEARLVGEIPHAADVIDQRVKPDVRDIVAVERQFNPPPHAALRARNAQILKRLAQEPQRLIAPEIRLNKGGMLLDIFDEPVLILAHPEEVVGLLDRLHRAVALGARALHQVLLRVKTLAGHAIHAIVFRAVNLTAVVQILQDFLHHNLVAVLGGADKVIVRDVQRLPEHLEADDGPVGLLLRSDPGGLRGLLNLLPMLIRARQKPGGHPHQAVIARQHVPQNRGVGVPDVRLVIDVINGRRDVIL